MLYHTNEKLKVFDSKPAYEAYQANVDLKKYLSDKVNSGNTSGNNSVPLPSLKELDINNSNHRLIISTLGLDSFYQF